MLTGLVALKVYELCMGAGSIKGAGNVHGGAGSIKGMA